MNHGIRIHQEASYPGRDQTAVADLPRIVQGILICTDSPYPIRAKEATAQTGAPFGASVGVAASSFFAEEIR